jgi:hypothetical protein
MLERKPISQALGRATGAPLAIGGRTEARKGVRGFTRVKAADCWVVEDAWRCAVGSSKLQGPAGSRLTVNMCVSTIATRTKLKFNEWDDRVRKYLLGASTGFFENGHLA